MDRQCTLPLVNLTKIREYVAAWTVTSGALARLEAPNSYLVAGESYTFAATRELPRIRVDERAVSVCSSSPA